MLKRTKNENIALGIMVVLLFILLLSVSLIKENIIYYTEVDYETGKILDVIGPTEDSTVALNIPLSSTNDCEIIYSDKDGKIYKDTVKDPKHTICPYLSKKDEVQIKVSKKYSYSKFHEKIFDVKITKELDINEFITE